MSKYLLYNKIDKYLLSCIIYLNCLTDGVSMNNPEIAQNRAQSVLEYLGGGVNESDNPVYVRRVGALFALTGLAIGTSFALSAYFASESGPQEELQLPGQYFSPHNSGENLCVSVEMASNNIPCDLVEV